MNKVGHYRKAIWLQNQAQTLETILRQSLRQIAANVTHVYDYVGGEQCLIARKDTPNGHVYLQFVTFEQGAGAAVIPVIQRQVQADAREVRPPVNEQFIISQVFAYISGDSVIWTTHNAVLRDASIYLLFSRLIESLVPAPAPVAFQFRAQLDQAAYRQAFSRGIAEIDLGVGDFQSTLEMLTNGQRLPRVGIMGHLRSLVGTRLSRRELQSAAQVEGRLTLRPGRDWDNPQVMTMLAKVAEKVVSDHGDEFTIVTKDGLRLTRDRMSVQRPFRAQGNRRILNATSVQTALGDIHTELRQAGVIG